MKSGKGTHKANTKAKSSTPVAAQVWAHRFKEPLDGELSAFLASIGFDHVLAWADIAGSIAHATMLGDTGVISRKNAAVLVAGLKKVGAQLASGEAKLDVSSEDIHMNLEALLRKEVGDLAGLLHAGRSRNDQVALDLRLYTREHLALVLEGLASIQDALLEKADEGLSSPHLEGGQMAVLPGHTHLQPAQPVLATHVFLAFVEKFQRDIERLEDDFDRVNISPLGAGALAGTGIDIDPKIVADMLGFDGTFANSLDAVSDRDFVLETLSDLSLISLHLSSLCEELIIWCSGEVGWAKTGDKASTGSSMMPQKKNPDVFELVRGKTGRVIGHATALSMTLKGLPLAYNKDLQEDKEATFDAFNTVEGCLHAMAIALDNLELCPEKMFLVKKGIPFREAHGIVGKLVLWCEQKGKPLDKLTLKDLRSFHPAFDQGCLALLTPHGSVSAKKSPGSTGLISVIKALAIAKARLKEEKQNGHKIKAITTKAKALL
jgi:argininosuccinate lyase